MNENEKEELINNEASENSERNDEALQYEEVFNYRPLGFLRESLNSSDVLSQL